MRLDSSKSLLVFTLLVSCVTASSQITDGNVKPEEQEKIKKEKTKKESSFSEDSLTGTNIYFTGLFQYAYRRFEDQSYNHVYKTWESQTPVFKGGISTGLIMDLSKSFQVDIGLSYFGNGEKYSFEDSLSDSTFSYIYTYRQVALPLRIRYTYGNKFQVFVFAGMAPLNILKLRSEVNYTRSDGVPVTPDVKFDKQGFATFNAMVLGGAGFQYNIDHIGFTLAAEYRQHLFNTYSTKSIPMDHKMYGIGINAGIVLRL